MLKEELLEKVKLEENSYKIEDWTVFIKNLEILEGPGFLCLASGEKEFPRLTSWADRQFTEKLILKDRPSWNVFSLETKQRIIRDKIKSISIKNPTKSVLFRIANESTVACLSPWYRDAENSDLINETNICLDSMGNGESWECFSSKNSLDYSEYHFTNTKSDMRLGEKIFRQSFSISNSRIGAAASNLELKLWYRDENGRAHSLGGGMNSFKISVPHLETLSKKNPDFKEAAVQLLQNSPEGWKTLYLLYEEADRFKINKEDIRTILNKLNVNEKILNFANKKYIENYLRDLKNPSWVDLSIAIHSLAKMKSDLVTSDSIYFSLLYLAAKVLQKNTILSLSGGSSTIVQEKEGEQLDWTDLVLIG